MPTYEYKCSNGHQYETREGFDAPPRQDCLTCGAPARRVLYPPPIVFKGAGFYVTDSRKGSSATVTTDGKVEKSETKEESKPAAATTSSSDSSSDD